MVTVGVAIMCVWGSMCCLCCLLSFFPVPFAPSAFRFSAIVVHSVRPTGEEGQLSEA